MQTKTQKRMVALERREKQLIDECEGKRRLNYVRYHLGEVNNLRFILNMSHLYVDSMSLPEIVITDGFNQFYPKEAE